MYHNVVSKWYIELTFWIHHWAFCVSQLIPLVHTESEGKAAINSSYFSTINPADGQCLLEKFSDKYSGCNFGLLGNLYACEGKTGKVILNSQQEMHYHHFFFFLTNNKHWWLYMNWTIIIWELITLECANFSPAACVLPTFGRIIINNEWLSTATCCHLITPMPPQVLEVRVKRRTGSNSLVAAMRKTLQNHYPDYPWAVHPSFRKANSKSTSW